MGSSPTTPHDASVPPPHVRLGRAGEEATAAHYLHRGYRLLDRNWRCPLGEVDLILGLGGMVVFCEVKARRGSAMGGPHDAVTWRKQRKLRSLADAWLARCGLAPEAVRFDVASVSVVPGRIPSVFVFEDAF